MATSAWTTPYSSSVPTVPTPGADPRFSRFTHIPHGWITSVDPSDGRMYYLHPESGRASYHHPLYQPSTAMTPATQNAPPPPPPEKIPPFPPIERSADATRQPDTHECHSITGFLCCPVIGLLAVYHACMVRPSWKEGRYGDAVHHARQAPKYASFAILLGCVFWIYYIFFRPESNFEWPDWDFDFFGE